MRRLLLVAAGAFALAGCYDFDSLEKGDMVPTRDLWSPPDLTPPGQQDLSMTVDAGVGDGSASDDAASANDGPAAADGSMDEAATTGDLGAPFDAAAMDLGVPLDAAAMDLGVPLDAAIDGLSDLRPAG